MKLSSTYLRDMGIYDFFYSWSWMEANIEYRTENYTVKVFQRFYAAFVQVNDHKMGHRINIEK